MKLRTILTLFVLGALLSAQELPDAQAGNFLYKMPDGWTRTQKADTTILYAPSSSLGATTFIAMAANDMEGDLQNSFNVLWTGLKNSYRVLQGGQTAPLHSPNGYDAFYTTAIAADQNGIRWTVYVLGAQYKQRIQTVMFMSNIPPGPKLTAYQSVLKTFLASLRFGDGLPGSQAKAPAAPSVEEVPHKLPPGALEGIYAGFSLGAAGRMELQRLNFNPDGWVVKEVPQEGMLGFDFTAYRNSPDTNRSWVGRYRVEGNRISILWQDYADDRQVITRNENSFSPGLNIYVPMCRCTGKKFSGKYNFGVASSGQYLQFFPDGTFIDHQVLDQMLVPNAFYDRPRIQGGTYSIQSQTMIFTFTDGHRGMRTFYAPKAQENGPAFDWIGLGWHVLYEEHHVSEP